MLWPLYIYVIYIVYIYYIIYYKPNCNGHFTCAAVLQPLERSAYRLSDPPTAFIRIHIPISVAFCF